MTYELKGRFAANLRVALADKQMTQEALGREIGVSLATVSGWCRGLSQPLGIQLVNLAAALDRDPEWFFSDPSPEDIAA